MQRRTFLKSGLFLLGSGLLPSFPLRAEVSDHFFLQVIFRGGWDPNYLFDARPWEMTQKGLVANYHGNDFMDWEGRNGVRTLASGLVRPLLPFKDDFSVLNGVQMSPGFDGHDQNMEYLVTGNPFGGDSFLPFLGQGLPLDYVQSGRYQITPANAGNSVSLFPGTFNSLVKSLNGSFPGSLEGPLYQHVKSAFERNAKGQGGFSKGTGELMKAHGCNTTWSIR